MTRRTRYKKGDQKGDECRVETQPETIRDEADTSSDSKKGKKEDMKRDKKPNKGGNKFLCKRRTRFGKHGKPYPTKHQLPLFFNPILNSQYVIKFH